MTEESTPTPMLPPPPDAGARPSGNWPERRWTRALTVVFVVGCLAGVLALIPAQAIGRIVPGHAQIDDELVAQKPGSARSTITSVAVDAAGVDEPEGAILFTTVALDTQISVLDWIQGQWDDDIVLRRREDVLGSRTVTENRERNLEMMRVSKDVAVIVALNHLGIAVIEETGVAFESVEDTGPAHSVLVPGDVIIAVDGTEITGVASLLDALSNKVPGEVGRVTVDNIDTLEIRTEELTWGINPDRPGGFIGIANVVPRQAELPLPFEVEIDSGNIGGPSAGLAFTLTILDLLTDGELTGGQDVAVTGTINLGGSVGNVGGLGQKAAAAYDAGAVAFLVPTESVELAEKHARDMPVIGVDTLWDALDALASLGGDTQDLELLIGV